MKILEAKFLKSVFIDDDKIFLDDKSEIIFVGRSNVGKSSIMNALMGKKDLVKTSSKPGKTRTANLFGVNGKYYYTDLPGYGFAKLGKEFRDKLDALISWYSEERADHIKKVVILIDSRLGAQDIDLEMYKFLLDLGLPITIVLSKIDKLSKNEVAKAFAAAKKDFFGQEILAVSSLKNTGIKELSRSIREALEEKKI